MKKLILLLLLLPFLIDLNAQAKYDGALERFNMKSNESVREGLIGEYYNGSNFNKLVKVRQDKEIYFDWQYKAPMKELDSDYFSVRWRGKVYSEKGGKYVFTLYTDDGMRLWLNGKLILNAWKDQPPTLYEKRVVLEADEFYDIRVDYYQKQYQTTAAVFFNPEGEERKPLNEENTVFGRDLAVSQATFEFYEKPSLVDEFWSWMGLDEENNEEIQKDQSSQDILASTSKSEKQKVEVAKEKVSIPEKPKQETAFTKTSTVKKEEVILSKNDTPEKTIIKNNEYEEMKIGDTLIINNIYFDQGKATLRFESYMELDKLYLAMKHHPEWKIKVNGHTDNIGYAALNLELSYDRARAVRKYLIDKGIEHFRVGFEGFGSSKPLITNSNEENRQKNRRVEVTFMDGGC